MRDKLIARQQQRARERLTLTRLAVGLAEETLSRCDCSTHREALAVAWERFDAAIAQASEWCVEGAPHTKVRPK